MNFFRLPGARRAAPLFGGAPRSPGAGASPGRAAGGAGPGRRGSPGPPRAGSHCLCCSRAGNFTFRRRGGEPGGGRAGGRRGARGSGARLGRRGLTLIASAARALVTSFSLLRWLCRALWHSLERASQPGRAEPSSGCFVRERTYAAPSTAIEFNPVPHLLFHAWIPCSSCYSCII